MVAGNHRVEGKARDILTSPALDFDGAFTVREGISAHEVDSLNYRPAEGENPRREHVTDSKSMCNNPPTS